MPRKQTDARERILAIAGDLFYREGIRATGVDRIIARSEVAKTTLYRYFPSKDDLVVAYLEERDQLFWSLLDQALAQAPPQPEQQLLAIFDWLDTLLSSDESQGCPFLMVASEFPEVDYVGHQIAIAHKQKIRDRFAALAQAMGIQQSQELATGLLLLADGTFAQRRLYQDNRAKLKQTATMLIQVYAG